MIAVVKANAYGHGAIEVSRTLLRHGVERLAVATLGEGLALRAAGIEAPILLLWGLGAPEVGPAHRRRPRADRVRRGGRRPARGRRGRRGAARIGPAQDRLRASAGRGSSRGPRSSWRCGSRGAATWRLAGPSATWRSPARTRPTPTSSCCGWRRRSTPCARRASIRASCTSTPPAACWPAPGASATRSVPGSGCTGWSQPGPPTATTACGRSSRCKALPLRIFDLAAGEPIGYGLRYRAERADADRDPGDRLRRRLAAGARQQRVGAGARRPSSDRGGGEHGWHHRRSGRWP